MANKRSPLWWFLLIPLVLLALFEPYEYIVPGSQPLSVRGNPFAAAEQLLHLWGVDSQHLASAGALYPLPGRDTLIVLTRQRSGISPQHRRALLRWVQAGGHLVVAAARPPRRPNQDPEQYWREHDPLLFTLGITSGSTGAPQPGAPALPAVRSRLTAKHLFRNYCVQPTDEQWGHCINTFCKRDEPWVASLLITPDGEHHRLALPAGRTLRHAALGYSDAPVPDDPIRVELIRHAGNQWGTQLATFRLGQGHITVLSGLSIWYNRNLYLLDHAWLLAQLTQAMSSVWIVQTMEIPPLTLWLWRRAWPVLLGALAVLILFIWRRMPRIAPTLTPSATQPPDFLDHLSAAGHFLWRTGHQRALLQPLRDDIRHRLAGHAVPRGERYRYIARRVNLDPTAVQRAMSDDPRTRDALKDRVSTLQQIRSRL